MIESQLLGMKKDEALALVKDANLFARVASEADKSFVGTVRFDRLSLVVIKGIVDEVVRG